MLILQRRRMSGFAIAALAPALLIGPAVVTGVTAGSAIALPTPRALGTGSQPSVAINAAGTAYVVWNGLGTPRTLKFCRVARGTTTTCAGGLTSTIATLGDSSSRPFVTVSGSGSTARVVVFSYRYPPYGETVAGTYRYTSTNGGATFSAGVKVGNLAWYEAVAGPGDTVSGASDADGNGMLFQNVEQTAVDAPATADLSDWPYVYYGSVGLVGADPAVVFSDASGNARFRRYSGSGSMNDAANWIAPIDVTTYARYPKLSGGADGLFLQASGSTGGMYVRKYNGSGFNGALSLGKTSNPAGHHISQDGGGRVHSVFEYATASGRYLKHWVTDDGIAWRGLTVAALTNPAQGFNDARVAVAPDHTGVAVWSTNSTNSIRLVSVGAVPKPRPIVNVGGTVDRRATGVPTTINGSLTRPTGVPASVGCAGTVTVKLKRGTTVIFTKTVAVSSTCKFGFSTNLSRAAVGASTTKLGVVARFNGNSALAAATKSRTLPVT